ncbi:hypothetical protein QOT17_018265 [Balamuthia mandrillaris]
MPHIYTRLQAATTTKNNHPRKTWAPSPENSMTGSQAAPTTNNLASGDLLPLACLHASKLLLAHTTHSAQPRYQPHPTADFEKHSSTRPFYSPTVKNTNTPPIECCSN